MNELELLFQKTDQGQIIDGLKARRYLATPETEHIQKQIDPKGHDVMDPMKREDKKVKVDTTSPDYKPGDPETRTEKVARVALALQRLIVNRAVSFIFGNAVTLNASPKDDTEKMVFNAVKRIMYDVKEKSFNRRVARELFTCTEVAEVWYPVEKKNNTYGFGSKFKLRCGIFSPLLGDKLYPFFDDSGDMLAFSREYAVKVGDKTIKYFETYTDTFKYTWVQDGSGFIPAKAPEPNLIGKIPVIFGHQAQSEWADVQLLIDRLEKLLSNFGDTNDYHASPKILVKGQLKGFAKKGDAGAILEVGDTGDAKYLSWDNAPEAVKLEIETLRNMIHIITQTPDISFDSVKGIGTVSGVALKLLFMDAHLKVADHQEVFDEYLQRRINVVKAFIGKFDTKLGTVAEDMQIEPEITPYMIKDEAAELKIWSDANGGNAVISQKASFMQAGMTQDPEADFAQYQEEQTSKNSFSFNEPTNV